MNFSRRNLPDWHDYFMFLPLRIARRAPIYHVRFP